MTDVPAGKRVTFYTGERGRRLSRQKESRGRTATFSTAVIGSLVFTYENRGTLGGRATAIFRMPLIYSLFFLTLNFSTELSTRGIERNSGTFNARDVSHNASSLSDNGRARRKRDALFDRVRILQSEIHETHEFQKKPRQDP